MTAGCTFDPEFGTFQYGGSSAEDWLGAFNGVTQTAFGMSEVAVGGALSFTPLAPLGWFLIAHGFDQSLAGVHQLVTGEHRSTLTSQLLQAGGVSPHRAELIDSGIAIAGTMGGAALLQRVVPEALLLSGQGLGITVPPNQRVVAHSVSNCERAKTYVTKFVGNDARAFRNRYGDLVLESKDGMRQMRMDVNHPYPHKNPHTHVIEFESIKNRKVVSTNHRIYPIDVIPE